MEWETNIIGRETRRNWAFPTKQIFKGAIVGRRYPSGVTHGIANRNLLPYSSSMSTKKVDNPHDLVARKYFSNPGAMGNFLREFLPREMYEALDISSLEPTRESFIAPGLKESIADIVFRCFTKDGKQGSIYIVFEHKHNPAPTCALQLLRYMALMWEDEVSSGRYQTRGKHLPFIIPIVFYHGKGRWNGRQMRELFVEGPPFNVCIPDFSMLVCNLAELSEEKLRANLTDNAMLLLLQALLLKHPVEQIARIFLLLDSAMNREVMDTIRLFLNYVQQTNPDITESHIKQSIEEIAMQEGITAPMKSFEEYWFPEFYNKGKEKGRVEGRAEGKAEGLRSAVTNLLLSRFEKIEPSLLTKVDQINDVAMLSSLVVAVAKASSLDDIQSLIERSFLKMQ